MNLQQLLYTQICSLQISDNMFHSHRINIIQKCHAHIFFKKSDCFAEISEKYDIIVSNPPYISREDESEVGLNVFHSEPHLALFADEDGLAIYRRIAEEAKDYLTDGGKIYLEIGYKQGQSVPALFRKYLPEKRVRTLKDQFGQDRMVVVDDGQD